MAAAAAPATRARANALLWAAARLAAFSVPLGLEPVPEVLLHPSVIERFAASAPGLSGSARRTLRTNLRFLARRVVPALAPVDAALPRERAKAPYSPAEIDGYLALADAQPTPGAADARGRTGLPGRRRRPDRGGPARRPRHRRRLPVRRGDRGGPRRPAAGGAGPGPLPPALLASAAFAGSGLVTGGTSAVRKNITTPLTRSLAGGAGLPRLEASRLRMTWLADCARLLGLATFMHAAGITCSQRLGDLLAALEPADEAEPQSRCWEPGGEHPALARIEEIIDASGIAPRIEALLPIGVRHRQLRVRTLLAGMLLSWPITGPRT